MVWQYGIKLYHLLRGHAYGLDCELATTHVKEILKVRTEEVNDEDVVESLLSEIVYLRYAS